MYALYNILVSVALIVADFARLALRVDYGHSWCFTRDPGVTAYRTIADLKPVYRESYDTHGPSLAAGQIRC
ncbi:hypothetical protein GHK50_33665 [Sinorhizobium medicae]|uniref:Uncharacterized protein n=1 Tax=Sinorhizobium medicae TaxID=110321 RepID=A0A6G1WVH1_9HYPH|nr:hypothetical protein [Sinorhizobium medicae]MQW73652.1 hypothetical protein [Sinorhizobium medicae]MQX87788.1 hypothetical protein [Sinorhizobium medicae]RVJ52060.1 hypothetical protein CN166_26450 [Sinorhizobium medicae]RVK11279.1 hypothetical protein CN165_27525 [Sinorhizobium medicae]